MSDEDLIEAVTRASASEKERIATQSKIKSKANKVYEVSVSDDSNGSKLLSVVESLTKQVSNMQAEMNEYRNQNVNRNRNYYTPVSSSQ